MKLKFILTAFLFLFPHFPVSANEDMAKMAKVIKEDNPEQFKAVLDSFLEAAKAGNVEKMVSLTSSVTINRIGLEGIKKYYKTDIIPAFRMCTDLSHSGQIIHVTKEQTGTGSGWVYIRTCKKTKEKSLRVKFFILKENERIVLTSIGHM